MPYPRQAGYSFYAWRRMIYSFFFYLLTPVILLRLLWRSRRAPEYRLRWGERFGFYRDPALTGSIWIHAVSVGETLAALPLIEALRETYPGVPLLVTCMTPTGSQRIRAALGEQVQHVYLPYDYPGAAARFLERFRPRLGVLMETELWPNLVHACALREIPLVLANARMSERSARGYAYVGGLTREMLSNLSTVAAQTDADAARLRALGAPAEIVQVTGSIKFDLDLPPDLPQRAATVRAAWGTRPVWIAASTHGGEDEQLLEALRGLQRAQEDILLVLVPRHPERFAPAAELCRKAGYTVAQRSLEQVCDARTRIYLGDTMGELLLLYAAADVAFVGGSLIPHGGHNPLEPAALGLPVLFGPHMFNFAEISRRLLDADAARQVHDATELAETVAELLHNPNLRETTGSRGRDFVAANRGALKRLLKIIAPPPL